jgi:hypothetical protein
VTRVRLLGAALCAMLLVAVPRAPSAGSSDVAEIRASRPWAWTTRVQRVSVVQRDGSSVWRQVLRSIERRRPDDSYAQLSVVEEPALLRDLRVLGVWGTDGANERWMYTEQFRRAKRLPPLERDGFFASVYGTLAVLQHLPFVIRESNAHRLRMYRSGDALTIVAATDVPARSVLELTFVGPVPLLTRLLVRDQHGRAQRRIRLARYTSVEGVPTPLAIKAETRDGAYTQFHLSDVAYDAPVSDEVFGVGTFGEAALP